MNHILTTGTSIPIILRIPHRIFLVPLSVPNAGEVESHWTGVALRAGIVCRPPAFLISIHTPSNRMIFHVMSTPHDNTTRTLHPPAPQGLPFTLDDRSYQFVAEEEVLNF